jgi:endoglucanase
LTHLREKIAMSLLRWRGFNLCELFVTADDPRWPEMTVSPRGRIVPDHLAWIAGWGFNFVRLPLSCRWWSDPREPFDLREDGLARVDDAVEAAARGGLHLSLNLHHAPGFCINQGVRDEGLAPEPFDLWKDDEARRCFVHHWESLARRYAGRSAAELSFDLVNEPARCSRAEHERVIRDAVAAIRAIDPARLIVIDGFNAGNEPCPELSDLGAIQSCRGYWPTEFTHHCAWWGGDHRRPEPRWPASANVSEGLAWEADSLPRRFAAWIELAAGGTPVFCGELGCHNQTPHGDFLRWLEDHLAFFRDQGWGWALWNFRGSFGLLDHGRAGAPLADWHGCRLDTGLLALLQRY